MKIRTALTYYPSNSTTLEELKNYVENMNRAIIEKINSDIEPTFIEQMEEPKNPRLGTVYYASGVTQVTPRLGWDPTKAASPIEGTGRGLWLYTNEAGVDKWKKLDT